MNVNFNKKSQKTHLQELERLFRNYNKDGSARKTEVYLRKKYDEIEYLWSEIDDNNSALQKLDIFNQPYFREKSFDNAQKVYKSFVENIQSLLLQLIPSSSSDSDFEPALDGNNSQNKMNSDDDPHQSTQKKQKVALFNLKLNEVETLLITASEITSSTSRGFRKAQMEMLKEAWGEFRINYFSLTAQDYNLEINYSEIQNKYMNLIGKLNEFDDDNAKIDIAQMPKIKIPEFDGTFSEWPSFIALFDKIVHTKTTIDDAIKIQYLKTSLKGEAGKLISHILPMAENYNSCYDILQRRYNNKREIFDTLFDCITDLPKQQAETYASLKQLHDTVYENMMAI